MAKILIAEDEPDIQMLIKLTLRHAGHEVIGVVEDGVAVVPQTQALKPDLILLDVKMPRLNGYDACRRLKADPALVNIPVIFLTVRGAEQEVREGFAVGAAEYLVKPFSPLELNAVVARVLGQTQ